MSGELKVQLSQQEIEEFKNVHNAQALKELTQHPGWAIYLGIIAMMVTRLENQHLNFHTNVSRDAYWISGARLDGVRSFAKILEEQIATKIDLLKQPLTGRNGNSPEEE